MNIFSKSNTPIFCISDTLRLLFGKEKPKNFLKNISRGKTLYHKINLCDLGRQISNVFFDISANFTINTKKIKLVEIF